MTPTGGELLRLRDPIHRWRVALWATVAFVTWLTTMLEMRPGLLAMVVVAALAAGLPWLIGKERRLEASFVIDAVAVFAAWWIVGPVAGLGVVLPLIVGIAGIVFDHAVARRILLVAVVSQAMQLPAHFLAKAMDGNVWLFHPPSQVQTESEFILGVVVAVGVITLSGMTFTRIGERLRAATERLVESEAAFRAAFTHAPAGVALLASDGGVLRSNPSFEALLPEAAATGRMQALDGTPAEPVCDALRTVLGGDESEPVIFEYEPLRYAEARVSVVPDGGHSLLAAVLHVEDVTERIEVARAKDAFLEAVTHEVRTPLTGVLGFSEILAFDPALDSIHTEMATEIREGALRIKALVDDLVVIARGDIDRLALHPTRVSVQRLVDDVLEPVHSSKVACSIHDVAVRSDPFRTDQVVRNMVDNAVRHGGDRIRIGARERAGMVQIVVADDGDGIAPEDRERVFEAYERSRLDSSLPSTVGLGLAVARGLARAMGGDLRLEDTPGWTTFVLELPADEPVRSAESVAD